MMRARQKTGWLRTIVLLTVAISLLFVLLIPQLVHHSCSALATIDFLPLIFFGVIQGKSALWPSDSLVGPEARPAPSRAALFQRPPPLLSA
jgi:hypothetical protein